MKQSKLVRSIKFIFSRTIILFVILAICLGVLADVKTVISASRLKVLNRLRPNTYEIFISYAEGSRELDPKQLQKFIYYYQAVTSLLPRKADAYGLLGFCSFQAGLTGQAVSSYKKAIKINPTFFWFYYNLGTIYLKTGDYKQSAQYYSKALKTHPQHAVLFISTSPRIYMPVLAALYPGDHLERKIGQRMKEGYTDAAEVLKLLLQGPGNPLVLNKIEEKAQSMPLGIY